MMKIKTGVFMRHKGTKVFHYIKSHESGEYFRIILRIKKEQVKYINFPRGCLNSEVIKFSGGLLDDCWKLFYDFECTKPVYNFNAINEIW